MHERYYFILWFNIFYNLYIKFVHNQEFHINQLNHVLLSRQTQHTAANVLRKKSNRDAI
jgi:hypothetical protein